MKKLLKFLFLISFMNSLYASLPQGHCQALVGTKKYLSKVFSSSYPKETKFTCEYECLLNDKAYNIKGTSTIKTYNIQDDAKKIVCHGVQVKKVSWGYEFDRVNTFYAHNTSVREIKNWAIDNMPIFSNGSTHLLRKFRKDLTTIIDAYKVAGNSSKEFLMASKILSEILLSLDSDKETLIDYLQELSFRLENNIKFNGLDEIDLVLGFLYAHARWMLK